MNRNRQRHADRSLPILSAAMLSVGGLLWQGACSEALAQSSSDVIVNYDVLNSLPGQVQPAPAAQAPAMPAVTLQPPSSDGSQPTVAAAVTPPEAPSEMPAAVPMPEATPPAPPPSAANAAAAAAAVETPTAPAAVVETPEAPAEEPAPVAAIEPPAAEPPAEQPAEVPPQEAAQEPPAPEQPAQEEPQPEPTAEQSTAETPSPEPSAESEPAPQPVEPPKAAEPAPAEAAQTEEQPSEEPPAEEAAAEPEPEPDNNRPAAPVPAGGIRIVYPVELNDVPVEANGALDDLAAQMAADETMRIQIKCYASGDEATESKARRRALARCINIRQYLYQKQILTTRMDVRALGLKSEGQPADRVDIVPANS